jgi:hypothetical protein
MFDLLDNEYSINSVSEFIEGLQGLAHIKDNLVMLFRGQECANWDLVPSIGRIKSYNILNCEHDLFQEFKRFAHPYASGEILNNEWNTLALAQHHGLPTRLLDWTTNPLIALWFAFQNEFIDCKDGERAVWLFIAGPEHDVDISSSPFNHSVIKAFKPNHITKRIIAQHGWFTAHEYDEVTGFSILGDNPDYKKILWKFVFKDHLRTNILSSLDLLGINNYTVFPDLDGLSKHLKWKTF